MFSISVVDVDKAKIRIDKCEAVARELDKYRNLLQELESKKIQMDDIIASATSLHGGSEEIINQINLLKGEWKRVQQKLLGRKTELTAMLEHSDNFDSKGKEVSEWLGKLERQLAGANVGRTRNVLLSQIREVNQVRVVSNIFRIVRMGSHTLIIIYFVFYRHFHSTSVPYNSI